MSLAMSKHPPEHLAHLQPPDHGTAGPAQKARPSHIIETIQAGVTARMMEDTHPIDRWDHAAQLTERQVDALWKLTRAFKDGKFAERAITPAYGEGRGGDTSPEAAIALTIARRNYDTWTHAVPHDCRHVLARVVRGEFPGVSGGLQIVRRAADYLADEMRLPRVVTGGRDGYSDHD